MKKIPSVVPLIATVLLVLFVFAATAEAQNIGSGALDQFVARTSGWWPKLKDYALYIFKITATLEVCLFGVRMVVQKSQFHEIVSQFLMTLLFICFIAAVIVNYEKWASAIALTGLKPVVGELSAGAPEFNAGEPVAMIFACLEAMIPVLGDASVWDFGMVMIYVFCMGAITAVFVVICCRYIILVCEFHIVANAGVILIGLGGSKVFKEYAFNVMKYVLSVGIKLFVFQLVCNIGFSILSLSSGIEGLAGTSIKNIDLFSLMTIVVQGAILLGLAWTLPQTCAGMLSGANIDSGNPLRLAAGMVAGQTINMVKSGAQSVNNIRTASKIATQEGAKGLGGRLRHMGQTMREAKMAANPTSVQNQLTSKLNSSKALSQAANTAKPH